MMPVLLVVSVVLAVGALLVFGVLQQAPDRTIDEAIARGEPVQVPPFDLEVLERGDLGPRLGARLDGALRDGRLSSVELVGVPYVLNVWASWCEPCRTEAPILQAAWRDARRQGVLVLGVDIQDIRSEARAFLAEHGVDYLNIRDGSDAVADDLGTTGVPETFAIDARGRVVAHAIGAVDADDVRRLIATAAS